MDERTPFCKLSDGAPSYVYITNPHRLYKKQVRQFQCFICSAILGIFLTALIITITVSVDNDIEDFPPSVSPAEDNSSLEALLSLSFPLKDGGVPDWSGPVPSTIEVGAAESAGLASLAARDSLEAGNVPLSADSPSYRHQQSTKTSADATRLARAGYAVEVATRTLAMKHLGGRSVGHGLRLSAEWLPNEVCGNSSASRCDPIPYRSIDGSCNNLDHPTEWGVAMRPFRRVLDPDYADGVSVPRMAKDGISLPSAREVSVTVHRPEYRDDPQFTVMLAVWGQFMDHDITATALSQGHGGKAISCCHLEASRLHPECYPVRLSEGDPFYHQYNISCMEFVRSAPAPSCSLGPREQLNQVSSYLDASVIYGSVPTLSRALRTFQNGRLRMSQSPDGRPLLPISTDLHDGCNRLEENRKGQYCFMSGDARANENLHLTSLHLLMARQHNRLAAKLSSLNPDWADERLYQEARRIVSAQMQHITYNEFLPVLLGPELMLSLDLDARQVGYCDDYNSSVDPTISNNFATAAFRFAHTLLPGLMKMLANDTSSNEFMELHRMLFNPYSLYKPGQLDKVLRGAMGTNIERADNYFNKEVTERLFASNDRPTTVENAKKPCGLDLVSLNVQRGRDHGLPGYPMWRQHCGLPRPANFDDLDGHLDPDSLQRMRNLYKSVDDIDLYTGALSEIPVSGGMLGPTVTCLIADQFKRLKVGDRYWYETPQQPQAFTPDQLNEIRKTSLAGIICNNADEVSMAQPYVMRSVSESNQRMNCSSLPQPDFTLWAQTRVANTRGAYARLRLVVTGGKVSTAEGVDLWSGTLPLVLPVAVFDASDTSSRGDLKVGILWSGTISVTSGLATLNGTFSFPQYIQGNTVNYTSKWINGAFSFVSNVLWNDTASESIQLSGTYETPVFLSERAEYNKVKLSDFNDNEIVYTPKQDTFDEVSFETSGLKSPIIMLGSFSPDKKRFYWQGEAILALPQSTNNDVTISANLQQEISTEETASFVAESKLSGKFTVVGGNMKIMTDGNGPVTSWSGAIPVSVPVSLFYDTAVGKVLFSNSDTKQSFGHSAIWLAHFSGNKLEGSFSIPLYSRNGSNFSIHWITGEFSFDLKPSENTMLEEMITHGVKYSSRIMFSETSPLSVKSSVDEKSSNIWPEPELSGSIAKFIEDAQDTMDGAISAPIILKGTFSLDKSMFSWNGDIIVKVQETKPKLAKQRVLLNTPNPALYPWHYNRIGAAIVDGEILAESKMIWSGSLPAEIPLAAFWNPGIQPPSKEVFSDGIIWSGSATESVINGTFLLAQYSRNETAIKWLPGTFSLLMRPLWFSPWASTIVPGLKYYSRIFFQGSKSFVDPRLSRGQSLSQGDIDTAVWAPIILQGNYSPDRTTFYWSGNVIVSIHNGPTHYYQLNAPQPQRHAVLRKDASDVKKASIEVTVTTGSLSIGTGNSTMALWSGSLPATIYLDSLISPAESQWSPFSQSSRVVWSGTISELKVEGIFAVPKYTINGSVPVTEWVSGRFSVDTVAKWGASLESILKTGKKYTFKVFFRQVTKSGSQIDHSTDLLLRMAGNEKNSLVSLIMESQTVIDDTPVGNLVLLGTFYEKSFYCSLLSFLCSNEKIFYWNGGAYVSVESSPKDVMQLSASGNQEKQFAGSVVSGSIQAGLGNESIKTVWSGTTPSSIPMPIFWTPATDDFSSVFSHGIKWTGSVFTGTVEGSFSLPQTVWDGTSYSTRQWNGNFSFKFNPLWNASLGNFIQPGLKYHSKIILQGSDYIDNQQPFTQGSGDHGDIESLWAPIILQGSYSPDHRTFYWTGKFIVGFKTHPNVESVIKYLPLPKQNLKKDDSKKPPKKPSDPKKPAMASVNFSVQSGTMSIYNASGEPSQVWSGELPATIHIDTLIQVASYGPPSASVIWSGSATDSTLGGIFTMPTYVQNGTDLLTTQLSGNFSFKFTVKYAASVTAVLKPDTSYLCKVLFKEKKKLTSKELDKELDPQHAVQLMLTENPNKSDESGTIILFGAFYERPFYCTLLPFLCSDESLFYWGGDAIVKVSNPSSLLSSTPSVPTIDSNKIITTHVKPNLISKSTILESKASSTVGPNITDEISPLSEKLMLEMNSSSAVFSFRQHVYQGSVNSGHLSCGESGSSLDDLWTGTFPVNISLPAFWTPSPATTDPDVDAYSRGIIWSAQIFQSTVQGTFSLQKHMRSGPISINQWWEGYFSFHVKPMEEGFSLFDFIIPGVNYYSPMGFHDFREPPMPTNYLDSPSQFDINSAIRAPIIMQGMYSADRRMFFWSGKFAVVFSRLPNPYM